MKTLLINFSLSLLFSTAVISQNLHFWGATKYGGSDNSGTIYKILNNGNDHEVMYSFEVENPGSFPIGSMVEGPDGMLYGVTERKGQLNSYHVNKGTLYKFNPNTNSIKTIESFNFNDSISPSSALVLGSDSSLYGLSYGNGTEIMSLIYKYDIYNDRTEILYILNDSTGYFAEHQLTLAPNNTFYGVNSKGGKHGDGTLFNFDPKTKTFRKIHDFHQDSAGTEPNSSLILASNGLYYGTCQYSYNYNSTLYSFDPSTDSVLFKRMIPGHAASNLIEFPDGVLHGSSHLVQEGGIYQYHIVNDSLFFPINFFFNNSPTGVENKFLLTKNEKVFFIDGTEIGAKKGIYEYRPQEAKLIKAGGFNFKDQLFYNSGLTEASNGKLYGTIRSNGIEGEGILFSIDSTGVNDTSNYSYQKILDFGYAPNGRNPEFSPTYVNGKFYGITTQGGKFGEGVLYSYNPKNKQYKTHLSFNDSIGIEPNGELHLLNNKLYGTCNKKTPYQDGTLFEFDLSNESFQVLFDFDSSYVRGLENPIGKLENIGNKLYGVTNIESGYPRGGVYEFDLSNQQFRSIKEFYASAPLVDYLPSGGLKKASDGNLYGLIGYGVRQVYRYNPSVDSVYMFEKFDQQVGTAHTNASSFSEYNQKLYAPLGEQRNILELNINGIVYTKRGLVDSTSRIIPYGELIESSGKLFGTSFNGRGNIFSYDFQNDSLKNFYEFNGTNGASPTSPLIELPVCQTLATAINTDSTTFSSLEIDASFQWLNCDLNYSPVLGETSASFTPTDSAFYAVEITKYGCVDTSECVSFRAVGIDNDKFKLETDANIYPNPFSENFIIEFEGNFPVTIKLFTQEGKVIFRKKTTSGQLITPDIKPGFYIVELKSEQSAIRKLLIKQ